MTDERVTLQTLATRLGVSRSTVSNAFNRPDQLSEELRNRILAAADELGYAGPDPAARSLRGGRPARSAAAASAPSISCRTPCAMR